MTTTLNRDRLGKVLALLASPVDGEALAAARMVVRLLAAAGMRPEELADPWQMMAHLRRPEPGAASTESAPPAQPTREWTPRPPKPVSVRDLAPSAVRSIIADLLAGELADGDRGFLAALAERLRTQPHLGLTTGEVRRLNRLWRRRPGTTGEAA